MKKGFLLTLFALLTLTTSSVTAHPQPNKSVTSTPASEATLLDGTEAVLFSNSQRVSRESAVKIEGMMGGHGSGTYIEVDDHYLVITARHVVDSSEVYYVSTPTEKVVGQVIWKSQTKDMAVLKIPRLTSRTAASLPRTGELDVGDEVTYTGYPADYRLLTTKARVSGHEGSYRATLLQGFVWFGYSGSGGFDNSGKLRTIIFAIAAESYRGQPQLLETLVYSHEISKSDVAEIRAAL